MKQSTKALLLAAIKNGLFWTVALAVVSYFTGGVFEVERVALVFLLFALFGATRKYLSLKSNT